MSSSFLEEHNIIFGLIFTLVGGYFFIRNVKALIDELDEKDYWLASYSIEILFGGGFLMVIGIILLFFEYPF